MKTTLKTIRIVVGSCTFVVIALRAVPECEAQSPYIPHKTSVSISPDTNGETVSVTVTVNLPSTCFSVGDWGWLERLGNSVYVNATFWEARKICLPVLTDVSKKYYLGPLAPGNYDFVFQAWSTIVKTQSFSVPERLSIAATQADSQIQLCWNTASNAWYRLEHCSTLPSNEWTPLTTWLPGNGNRFCTNDVVFLGQSQGFYRVGCTNAPTSP